MGRGRNRKARNFATFRLCPRPGAADASDRVFVRVDDNPYSVPGFGGGDGGGAPSSSVVGEGDEEPSSSSAAGGGDALPEHARREILELGLPDDGYDYLAHLREFRPSLSSTGGGGSSAVFLPSRRRPARSGLPVDVKAYDLSRSPIGSRVAAPATGRVEEAIDLDVAKLLDDGDSPAVESGDEDLEEDFVILANQTVEEQQVQEEKIVGGSKEKSLKLLREQFDSLTLEECAGSEDCCNDQNLNHGLSQEVIEKPKLPHSGNFDADEKHSETQYVAHRTLESVTEEQIGASSNTIIKCAGYAERYERREEEQVTPIPESSDGSAVSYCGATVSGSHVDIWHGPSLENTEKKLLKFAPGETSMKKVIIRKGMEKLPTGNLPQRRTSSAETSKHESYYNVPKEEAKGS